MSLTFGQSHRDHRSVVGIRYLALDDVRHQHQVIGHIIDDQHQWQSGIFNFLETKAAAGEYPQSLPMHSLKL